MASVFEIFDNHNRWVSLRANTEDIKIAFGFKSLLMEFVIYTIYGKCIFYYDAEWDNWVISCDAIAVLYVEKFIEERSNNYVKHI